MSHPTIERDEISVHNPRPEPPHLPDPTPWPMVLALGMTILAAGIIVEPFVPVGLAIAVVGAVIFGVALYRLIREDIVLFERHDQ